MSKTVLLVLCVAGAFLVLFLCMISRHFRRIVGTLMNSLLGVGLLMASNMLGASFAVAVNLPTLLISVILGVPGITALFLLKLILNI